MSNIPHSEASGQNSSKPLPTENASDIVPDENSRRNHMLAALRVARVRLQLAKCEVDSIGTALNGGLIGPDEAIDWLDEVGALPLIDAVLGTNEISEEVAR